MPPKKRAWASSSSGSGAAYEPPHIIDVEEETWDIRGPGQNIFDTKLEYASSRDRFSLAVHHGGTFVGGKYLGGVLNYIDQCTVRQFELVDLSSIMLKLGYSREYICEFYYAHPAHNHACEGYEVGHPLSPLIDEEHLKRFKQLANKLDKLVHIYVLEITLAEARARQHKDQLEYLKDYFSPKSEGVVIEEIDEPPLVVPKQRPRKKAKVNPVNPGFEEYLVDSLTKALEQSTLAEAEKEGVASVEQVLVFF